MPVQGGCDHLRIECAGFELRVRAALEFSEFAAMIAALLNGTGTSMPIYEYQCQDCRLTTCPTCGKESLKKLVSAVGFQLKGTGWYETDFKGKPKAPRGGDGESSSSSDSSSSSSSSSETSSTETKTKSTTSSADD